LRVTAVGFYLALGRHMGAPERTDREACPTLSINWEIWVIRGEYL
jgi:hypothetical protein